jgi:transcriptional regulator with GAF, ATPase, and Fis domain
MAASRRDTPVVIYTENAAQAALQEFSSGEREILERVNRRVATASTLENLLKTLFEDTSQAFSCDRMGLAFVDEGRTHLVSTHVVASYRPLRLNKGYAAPLAGSSLETVIARGAPRIIGDLEQYLAEHPDSASSRLAVGAGIRSSMTCPLVVEGRSVGVLFLSSLQKWSFGEVEVRLFEAITGTLSAVVQRAWRLYQLERASRTHRDELFDVARRMKGSVAALSIDARLLRSGSLGALTEAQASRLDGMVDRLEILLGALNQHLVSERVRGIGPIQAPPDVADVPGPGAPTHDSSPR